MDRRLLLLGIVAVFLGGVMSKQVKKNLKWAVYAHFVGGPNDGGCTIMGAVGPDPVAAVLTAVDNQDIPDRVKLLNHTYEIRLMSVDIEVTDGVACAIVEYEDLGRVA